MASPTANFEAVRVIEAFLSAMFRRYGGSGVVNPGGQQANNKTTTTATGNSYFNAEIGYVLDGFVLAIDDNESLRSQVIHALHSCLRSCTSPGNRYHLWCCVDALLKNSKHPAFIDALCQVLPSLVSNELVPYLTPSPAASSFAVAEFLHLYVDMLRSWVLMKSLFSGEVLHLLEDHLKHALLTTTAEGGGGRGEKVTSADQVHQLYRRLINADDSGKKRNNIGMMRKRKGVVTDVDASDHDEDEDDDDIPEDTSKSSGTIPPSKGSSGVNSFVNSMYDSKRTPFCCIHCGAQFNSQEARNTHNRMHFAFRPGGKTESGEDAVIRLYYPDAASFITSHARNPNVGTFLKQVGTTGECEKLSNYQCQPRLEKGDRGEGGASPLSRKRTAMGSYGGGDPRNETAGGARMQPISYIPVVDLSIDYTCAVCHQSLVPKLDARYGASRDQEWVLEDCQQLPDGQFVHSTCLL